MRAAHVTDFKADLDAMLDRVAEDHEPLIVTRGNGRSVVILTEEAWSRVETTLHLLGSPHNARRLAEAVIDLDAGKAEPPLAGSSSRPEVAS